MATVIVPTIPTIPTTPELSRAYKVRAAALDMRKCERSLAWFVRRAWPRYETAQYLDNWHIDLVCDHVQACYLRQIMWPEREGLEQIKNAKIRLAKKVRADGLW